MPTNSLLTAFKYMIGHIDLFNFMSTSQLSVFDILSSLGGITVNVIVLQ